MTPSHLYPEQKKNAAMPRVSWRTFVLMLELLVAVVAFQYLTMARPAQATTIWLAGDGHTASGMQQCLADPAAAAPAPVTTGEGTSQP